MRLMQAVEKFRVGWRSRKETRRGTETDQKLQLMGPYLQHFNVDKVALKKSPMGGWLITFEDLDPTEQDNLNENLETIDINNAGESREDSSDKSLGSHHEDF